VSRILLEDTFDFKIDRTRITESKDPITGLVTSRIPGTLSLCDVINGNQRRYGKRVWEKNLEEGSVLTQMFKRHSSFGQLEHPKDGKVDLSSPISHLTTEAKLTEREIDGKKLWVVEGVIELLNDGPGTSSARLEALIKKGYDPLVSSRGYGTLVKDQAGVDEVQDDYVCEGWDIVSAPSFGDQAKLNPIRKAAANESLVGRIPSIGEQYAGLTVIAAKKTGDKTVELTMEDGSPITVQLESVPAPTPPATPAPAAPPSAKPPQSAAANNNQNIMDIKTIRESIQALKAADPATLNARDFALGFQRMSELHNAAAKVLSENTSASWEVQQVHQEISGLEEAWTAAFNAPRAEVKKLTENQTKLLKVLKGVIGNSIKIREALTTGTKKATKTGEVAEALVKRGRAWMEAARRSAGSSKLLEKKYGVATEALDIMAARYKGDVAELGARVLELEFPTMTNVHKKAIAEARTPRSVIAARALIERDLKPKADPKLDEAAKKKAAEAKKLDEAKGKELSPLPTPEVIDGVRGNVVGVTESISMVRRLATSNSQFHS
jgi:hypothetical protein